MTDYVLLLAGVLGAGLGGGFFVRGLVGIAHWARIPAGIVGATIAAFATSSPELSVAVLSAVAGKPELSFGDALGSNVVNVALILGLALAISGIRSPRDIIKRDFPVALLVPVLIGALAFDGVLSRRDGVALLAAFSAWLIAVVVEVRRQRSAAEAVLGTGRHGAAVLLAVTGLLLLIAAGRLIVLGATGIAASFGVSAFVIGAVVVAVGTSIPELATAVISKLRGHDEIGLGTVLGSNVFNGLFIVAIAAVITPIVVDWREAAIALFFGMAPVAVGFPGRDGYIGRTRGVLLLALYGLYLAGILM